MLPAIAILPFRNRSGNSADDALIDGLVEEITYGLARFKSIERAGDFVRGGRARFRGFLRYPVSVRGERP